MAERLVQGVLSCILIVVLLVGAAGRTPVAAQDPQMALTETFTTSDGLITVNYPEAWGATEFIGVLLSNDATLLETLDFETLPQDVFIMIVLSGLVSDLVGGGSSATFVDLLEFVEDEAESNFTEYSGPKLEEFEGRAAYRTLGHSAGQESVFMYIDVGDGYYIGVGVVANDGEMQQFGPTIEAVVRSARFSAPEGLPEPVEVAVSGNVIWKNMEMYDYEDYAPIGDIAIGADDRIYIAGYYSGITVYDAEGNLQDIIGDTYLENEWTGYAEDLAIAPDGTLWIADANQHVTHIDANGIIINSWGELGEDEGEFGQYSPSQIEVLPNGQVVVLDQQETDDYYSLARIQVWDADGLLLKEFTPEPAGFDSVITGYADMELGPDGALYIATDYEVWEMDLTTGELDEIMFETTPLSSDYIEALAIGAEGQFVLAGSSGSIYQFDAQGRYVNQFGTYQSTSDEQFLDGEFYGPRGIGVLSNGQVVVSDYNYSYWQVVAFTFEE